MLTTCPPGSTTTIGGAGVGPNCALVVAQPGADPGGWLCELQAEAGAGFFVVRRFMLTAPFRASSRVVASCTFPGARRWQARLQPPAGLTTAIAAALQVSLEPFALGELEHGQPGARGYGQAAAPGAAVVAVPPGARVQEVSAVGDPGGTGSITIDVWRDATVSVALPAVPLPLGGLLFSLPMRDIQGAMVRTVTFANVVSHFVGWVE